MSNDSNHDRTVDGSSHRDPQTRITTHPVDPSRRSRVNGADESGAPEFEPSRNGGRARSSFDVWTLIETVLRKWYWLFLGACVGAAAGGWLGMHLWTQHFTATVQLMRFDPANNSELFKPRQLSEQTFAGLLRSPELMQRVAASNRPPISADRLAAGILITPKRESDMVAISVVGQSARAAVHVANLFAAEAVRYTQNLQAREASEVNNVLKQQLAQMDSDISQLNAQLQKVPKTTATRPLQRSSLLTEKLQTAQEELANLLARYTELHPLVREQNAKINVLQKQIADLEKSANQSVPKPGSKPPALADSEHDGEVIRSQLQALANSRLLLATRQREAQMFIDQPPGYCRVFAPSELNEVVATQRGPKVAFLSGFGGVVGMASALLLILLFELLDPRLKTGADVQRVTGLPLLGALGSLHKMNSSTQTNWAFRTWIALHGHLSPSANRGLVCGITSANEGEGRSTWVNLLAQAASDCGYRVLTISAFRSDAGNPEARPEVPNGHAVDDSNTTALTTSVLNTPAQVTEQLTGENPQPFVHIPLPGWVWNLERRKQWQAAIKQWRTIENVVIFVELPPAANPESVLLAENLPNLLWLSEAGSSKAADTREQLETLRNARCHLVGSVLNREQAPVLKKRFSRWLGCWALLLSLGLSAAQAQETNLSPTGEAAARTNLSLSALNPGQRAEWQKRLTLGPGDLLNFSFFGQPELARTEVPIGPDGRVSYLQAQDVVATGLTVDELRSKFDQELSKFYRSPRTIITPFAYNSKKYYVLGKVVNKGVFPLDRPVTVVEAVARARGFENGIIDNQNSVDLVDLQKSFIMRQNQRLAINLEKLFQEGDLSQNVALEPDDYLYFAAGNLKEVYVLGEVKIPGPLSHTASTTVISAISARGGFTDKAYKTHVVVIRGSLSKPRTYVVNTWATLDARAVDFKLEPKDIIYVSRRPFIKAEELLDLAATAFIQSAVSAWAGKNIGPIITSPFIPNL